MEGEAESRPDTHPRPGCLKTSADGRTVSGFCQRLVSGYLGVDVGFGGVRWCWRIVGGVVMWLTLRVVAAR